MRTFRLGPKTTALGTVVVIPFIRLPRTSGSAAPTQRPASGRCLEIVDLRTMGKSGERDPLAIELVDPAIVPYTETPRGTPSPQRANVETGPRPSWILLQQPKRAVESKLNLAREASELTLGTRLEEDLGQRSELQAPPDFVERDARLLMEAPIMFSPEPRRRDLLHELIQHVIVGRIAHLVRLQFPQGVGSDGHGRGRGRHLMVTMVTIVLTLGSRPVRGRSVARPSSVIRSYGRSHGIRSGLHRPKKQRTFGPFPTLRPPA
jgi:hypothetical protein